MEVHLLNKVENILAKGEIATAASESVCLLERIMTYTYCRNVIHNKVRLIYYEPSSAKTYRIVIFTNVEKGLEVHCLILV